MTTDWPIRTKNKSQGSLTFMQLLYNWSNSRNTSLFQWKCIHCIFCYYQYILKQNAPLKYHQLLSVPLDNPLEVVPIHFQLPDATECSANGSVHADCKVLLGLAAPWIQAVRPFRGHQNYQDPHCYKQGARRKAGICVGSLHKPDIKWGEIVGLGLFFCLGCLGFCSFVLNWKSSTSLLTQIHVQFELLKTRKARRRKWNQSHAHLRLITVIQNCVTNWKMKTLDVLQKCFQSVKNALSN